MLKNLGLLALLWLYAGGPGRAAEERSIPPPPTKPDTATLSVAAGWMESDRWFTDTIYQGQELAKASRNSPYLAVRGSYTPPTRGKWRVRLGADFTVLYRAGEPASPSWNDRKSDDRIWMDADVTLWHADYPRWRLRFFHRSDQALSTARYTAGYGTLERENRIELEYVILGTP